jgi:hypothetical protein
VGNMPCSYPNEAEWEQHGSSQMAVPKDAALVMLSIGIKRLNCLVNQNARAADHTDLVQSSAVQ